MNYITLIFSIVISIACFWASIKMIRLYFKVKKWMRVSATIISKEIFVRPKYSTTRTPYGLKTEYIFKVNGIEYKGYNIYLTELIGGQVNHMKKDAERRLSKIENTMEIYVDTTDLNKSVIYCEGIGLYIFIFFMGLISLLIGVANLKG